jgi:hypothetical protein
MGGDIPWHGGFLSVWNSLDMALQRKTSRVVRMETEFDEV